MCKNNQIRYFQELNILESSTVVSAKKKKKKNFAG